ncbi:MAG: sigma-70 family RNA polymerase sigma factor, partial [Mangrovibacterium sp.]
ENFHDQTNINAWLYTVAKHKALKFLGKELTKQRYIDHEKYTETNLQLDALSKLDTRCFDDDYIRDRVIQSLQKLSEPVRRVFMKQRFEGKTNKELADELHLSIKTIEAHTTKALKQLRIDLNDLNANK